MTTAATTAGAVIQYISGLGLGLKTYRDQALIGQKPPYVVVLEAQALVPAGLIGGGGAFGGGSAGAQLAVEQVQIDLYQLWRDDQDQPAEDYSLYRKLVRLLHGAQLNAAPTRAYLVLVVDAQRLPVEVEAKPPGGRGLVHHAITLSIHQQL